MYAVHESCRRSRLSWVISICLFLATKLCSPGLSKPKSLWINWFKSIVIQDQTSRLQIQIAQCSIVLSVVVLSSLVNDLKIFNPTYKKTYCLKSYDKTKDKENFRCLTQVFISLKYIYSLHWQFYNDHKA